VIYEQPKKIVKYPHRSIIKQITACTQIEARKETNKKNEKVGAEYINIRCATTYMLSK